MRDLQLANYVPSAMLLEHAGRLLGCSSDLTALTNGADYVDDAVRAHARDLGIVLDERKIARLDGVDGQRTQVVFEDGSVRGVDFLFAHTEQHQTPLVQALVKGHGLKLDDNGSIVVNDFKQTTVDGIAAFGGVAATPTSALESRRSDSSAWDGI